MPRPGYVYRMTARSGQPLKTISGTAAAAVLIAIILGAAGFYQRTEARLTTLEVRAGAEMAHIEQRLGRIEEALDRIEGRQLGEADTDAQ